MVTGGAHHPPHWSPVLAGWTSPDPDPLATTTAGNESDFDVTDYLTSRLGWRHRSQAEAVTLTLTYCLILLTGLVGNLTTCAVIVKNLSMHTATNFYLFSLAVSDSMALILGLPTELYTIWEAYPWRLGQPYCLFKTFLTEAMSSASILTITAFTVERYVAICHPLKAHVMSSLSRAVRIILVIWAVAGVTALPYPVHTRTYHYVHDPFTRLPIADSLVCNIPLEWMPKMKYYFLASTLLLFVLPMVLMTVLYLRIWTMVRKSRLASRSFDSVAASGPSLPNGILSGSRKAVLRILVAVLVMFFVCWAPFHIQRIMTVCIPEEQWTATAIELQSNLFYVSGILYYVSSTVNPILYNLMSYKYRQAFRNTLCLSSSSSSSFGPRSLSHSRRRSKTRICRSSRGFSETSLGVSASVGAARAGGGGGRGSPHLLMGPAVLWATRRRSVRRDGGGWRRCLRARLERAWKRRRTRSHPLKSESSIPIGEGGTGGHPSGGGLGFGGDRLLPYVVVKSVVTDDVISDDDDESEKMMSCSPASMAAILREELEQMDVSCSAAGKAEMPTVTSRDCEQNTCLRYDEANLSSEQTEAYT